MGPTRTTSSPAFLNREFGLSYLRARYYDPTTAQFMSSDPAAIKTRSRYGYSGANPINGLDPSGLDYNYYFSYNLGPATATRSPSSVLWWLVNRPGYEWPFTFNSLSYPYTAHGPGDISGVGAPVNCLKVGGIYAISYMATSNPIVVDEAAMEGNVAVLKFTALLGHSVGAGSTIRFSSWVAPNGNLMFDVTGHDTFNNDGLPAGWFYNTLGWGIHAYGALGGDQSTWDQLAAKVKG